MERVRGVPPSPTRGSTVSDDRSLNANIRVTLDVDGVVMLRLTTEQARFIAHYNPGGDPIAEAMLRFVEEVTWPSMS